MRTPRLGPLAGVLSTSLSALLVVLPLIGSAAPAAASPVSARAASTRPASTSAASTSPERRAASPRRIDLHTATSRADFAAGRLAGVRAVKGKIRLGQPVGSHRYDDPFGLRTKRYEFGRWTSPWHAPGFGLTELVASWEAATPGDSWIEVRVRGRDATGARSSWDTLGRWASGDRTFHRTTAGAQRDDLARVATDTWRSNRETGLTSWQLRVTLNRRIGSTVTPSVYAIGAMSSRLPDGATVPTSRPGAAGGAALGTTLPVPRFSQMIHDGEYPRYGGGGEAWCSPTSTSMVLAYDESLPRPDEYSWVDPAYAQPWVDHAARMTFDNAYDGTGNWPFNTAYAAQHVDQAFVTRLRSLREAELFVARGIPLVASISFARGELDNAPISASNGHLVVIVGFTRSGDVVVNDPAARHAPGVRRRYDRGQFENAWLPRSGGLVYVLRNRPQELPARHGRTNW